MEQQLDTPLSQNALEGPGKRLRLARQAMNLSVEQVAESMHLGTQVVQLIEADDYAHAPEPIYVRGYLRAYAKLVNLPTDEIIEAYNQLGYKDKDPGMIIAGIYKETSALKDHAAPLIAGVSIFIVIVMAIMLWHVIKQRNPPATMSASTGLSQQIATPTAKNAAEALVESEMVTAQQVDQQLGINPERGQVATKKTKLEKNHKEARHKKEPHKTTKDKKAKQANIDFQNAAVL